MKKPHLGDRLYNRDREVKTVGVRVAERIVVQRSAYSKTRGEARVRTCKHFV